MSGWDRLLDSFFNLRVAADYLPKIVEAFWLTIILALGTICGLGPDGYRFAIDFTLKKR